MGVKIVGGEEELSACPVAEEANVLPPCIPAPSPQRYGASATRKRGEQDSLLVQGRTEAAMTEWRRALALDPGNWIIHKQIWAVEHPEAFYEGAVDYDWQKQQRRREEAAAGGTSPQ